jgi:hypothetical protein
MEQSFSERWPWLHAEVWCVFRPERRIRDCGTFDSLKANPRRFKVNQASTRMDHLHRHVLEDAAAASSECGELLLDASLSQKGDPSGNGIWVARLTHDRKVRGTTACRGSGDRPESVRTGSRKARVAWSRLDCLKSNPDRNTRGPDATLTQRVVIMCPGSVGSLGLVRRMRYRGIDPGRRDEWTA